MAQLMANDGLPFPRGRASRRKNTYNRSLWSDGVAETVANDLDEHVEMFVQQLIKQEVWEREITIAIKIVAGRNGDEEAKYIVSALVRIGSFYPEVVGAMERAPRIELTARKTKNEYPVDSATPVELKKLADKFGRK
jgi:hypothetical protein